MVFIEKVVGKLNGKPLILRVSSKSQISRENKVEHNNAKRMKELHKRGYSVGQIAGMMYSKKGEFKGKEIEKAIKSSTVRLDGNL